MKKISIFFACYNENNNINELYNRIIDVISKIENYTFEIIASDNCSVDGTQEILEELAQNDKRFKIIFNNRNYGAARSSIHGMLETTGDATICLASDLQDPPELIPHFIKEWEKGNKVVWAQKNKTNETLFMKMCRSIYYKLISSFSENDEYKNVTGFGLYDKEVVDLIRKYSGPFPNIRLMIPEFGYNVSIVPFEQPQRKAGKSSYNFWKYLDTTIDSIVSTSRLPIKFVLYFGLINVFGAFFGVIMYLILSVILNYHVMPIVFVIFAIAFFSGVILSFMGIIGEYIYYIQHQIMNYPVVERKRINFD